MIDDIPMPSNIDIEREVAGSLIHLEEDVEKYASLLRAEDFTDPQCLEIARCVRMLIRDGEPVDVVSLCNINPNIDISIFEDIATTANIEARINQLKLWTAKREAIAAGHSMITWMSTQTENIVDTIGGTIQSLENAIESASAIKHLHDLSQTESVLIQDGVSTGFITWDANDSGLKDGRLTLLLGARGMGKTTIARQSIMAIAKQEIQSFYFCGETSIKEEKSNLARLCALDGEIQKRNNIGDRTLYYPTKEAGDRFNKTYAPYITLVDPALTKNPKDLFNTLHRQMKAVLKNGCKVFLIDSMMKVNNASGSKKFTEQQYIVTTLKDFAVQNNVHVILIVHPSKHHSGTSGVAEQENLADTILRYVRIYDDKIRESVLSKCDFPDEEKDNISAVVLTEKIRDQGNTEAIYLEWNATRGAVIEVSNKSKAIDYQSKGYWTRHIPRITPSDLPNYDTQIGGN